MADEPTTEPVAAAEQPELIVPAVGSKKKAPGEVAPDGDLCGDCFPAGWPDDATAASCLHGTWTR